MNLYLKLNKIKKIRSIIKLKKGDIVLIGPRFNSITLKVKNFSSYIISKLCRGITHSCIYMGKDNIFDMDFRLIGKGIRKIKLNKLIKEKISKFKEINVYIVEPKIYQRRHRINVLREAINNFLMKKKEISFSYTGILKILFVTLLLNKSYFYKKEKLQYKKEWYCSNLVAYILRKAKVPIGKRATSTFMPNTFAFSRHFKIKKRITIS